MRTDPTRFEAKLAARRAGSDVRALTAEVQSLEPALRELAGAFRRLGGLLHEWARQEIEKDPRLLARWQAARFTDPNIGILDVACMDAGKEPS